MNKSITESINDNSKNIDTKSTIAMLETINNEDKNIAPAIEKILPIIAELVDKIVINIKNDGRIIYMGAGTSGRLGILDASECPPTFSTEPELVVGLIAGGDIALRTAVEGAEDSYELGMEDLVKINVTAQDTVIGIAASGNTPYVYGALQYAQKIGALTGAISSNEHATIFEHATYCLLTNTGAEVLSGSTRMKAGTAQKMVLNMITTTTMIKLGKVYKNLMVDVKPSNKKLVLRSLYLIGEVVQCDERKATNLLKASGENVKVAIVMGILNISKQEAIEIITKNNGFLHSIINT